MTTVLKLNVTCIERNGLALHSSEVLERLGSVEKSWKIIVDAFR